MLVCVPVRYPITDSSWTTLERAIAIAGDENATLAIVHVNLYQNDRQVTRQELRRAVRNAFDVPQRTRYVIRKGFVVEEVILETVVELEADVVVLGAKQQQGFRRLSRLIFPDTGKDIDEYLCERYDCDCIVVDDRG